MDDKRMSEIPVYARLYYLHGKPGTNQQQVEGEKKNQISKLTPAAEAE